MLRWVTKKPKPSVKKKVTVKKKRAASVRIRRSTVTGNMRLCRNILRLA